jgi:DNA-binding transcriptional MerR regulator
MPASTDRYFQISEVCELTGLPAHLLRQWEEKFPQLKPKRSRTGRRYYTQGDIDIVKRINYLMRHEKLTASGAKIRLAQELHGEGRPRSRKEAIDLLDTIEKEVRTMLDLLRSVD